MGIIGILFDKSRIDNLIDTINEKTSLYDVGCNGDLADTGRSRLKDL